MKIVVACSPAPRVVREWALDLPQGASVRDAVRQAGVLQAFPALDEVATSLGIWGKKAGPDRLLVDGDRVEIYRELRVDPKVARRERFKKQGAKGTGLFAGRRVGAKAGY